MSKNKPLVGVNGDYRAARKDAVELSWFNAGYYDTLTAAGAIPLLIPPLAEDDDLKSFLGHLDGLVLAACNLDLDPVRLGLQKHPSTRPMPARREDFDRRLCKLAFQMKLPVLAIGVGMQEMNVVCGGTLHQHIPDAFPRALHHRDPVETTLRHIIEIVPGTRVDHIYGPGEIRVNSQHHMCVDHVAPPFRVSATAPDGVVEAYESVEDDWYCLGVQWHPHNETASALDMQVVDNFLEACGDVEPTILKLPTAKSASGKAA